MKKYKGIWKPEKAKPVKIVQPLDLRSLWIGGKVDFEGDLSIIVGNRDKGACVTAYIDEHVAIQIIEHLENVFQIERR